MNKLNSLYLFIKKNKDFKWNKKGEIIYKNRKIIFSNIGILLKHAITNKKSSPKGMKEFYKILTYIGVPNFLVSNETGKKIMQNLLNEKNENIWRPPGKLVL